jgi:hypothetical protein
VRIFLAWATSRGTYYEQAPPAPPHVHMDEAARPTVEALAAASGVVEIVEE